MTDRCPWCGSDPQYVAYHDTEWGVPIVDERGLFERLSLEGFQSGLSWLTILRRRDAFRRAFHDFDPVRVAAMDERDATRLVQDPSIIRHRGKIDATIGNARALLQLHRSGTTLVHLFWHDVDLSENATAPRTLAEVPSRSARSEALAKSLRKAGFRFVGPTTIHAALQAVGVVNEHLATCFRRTICARLRAETRIPGR